MSGRIHLRCNHRIFTLIYNQQVRKVQLFVTCLVDTFFPRVGEAMLEVLERAGVEVDFPRGQTCCGQPLFNAGLRNGAKQIAENAIRTFEAAPGDIVIPSGSCTHMIRHNYEELFGDDPSWLQRAKTIGARTFEFTEYLVDILGVTDCNAHWDGAARLPSHVSLAPRPRDRSAATRAPGRGRRS